MSETLEDEIVRLWEQGRSSAALELMVKAWRRPLFGYLRTFVKADADVDDVLQSAFTRVAASLGTCRGWSPGQSPDAEWQPAALRAWVYRIATNCASSLLAKQAVARDRLSHPSALSAACQSEGAIGSNLDTREKDVLDAFSEHDLRVCHLRYHAGFQWEEIAKILLLEEEPGKVTCRRELRKAANTLKQQQSRLIKRLTPFARAKGVGSKAREAPEHEHRE